MNNTGKTISALLAMGLLLAIAWFGLARGPQDAGLAGPPGSAGSSGSTTSTTDDPSAIAVNQEQQLWWSEVTLSVSFIADGLITTGNVPAAITLLDSLDRRVAARPVSPIVTALRRAIATDREILMVARTGDIATAASLLDRAMQATESLRLVSSPGAETKGAAKSGALKQTNETSWQEIVSALQSRFTEVVRIRRIEHPDAVFLTPEQGVFVRERLRLRFLSAKLALLSRQEAVFTQDLVAAERILQQAFDPNDPNVSLQLASIANLKKVASQLAPLTLRELPKFVTTLQEARRTP